MPRPVTTKQSPTATRATTKRGTAAKPGAKRASATTRTPRDEQGATARRTTKTSRGATRRALATTPPPIDAAVEALVAWAIEEGLRTGDLDDLVLDAHLDLARRDHVPEHIKISGQRDAVCEAEEEKAYDAALAVNLSGFNRQFRFLVERIATPASSALRTTPDPVETIRGWVERYRAG